MTWKSSFACHKYFQVFNADQFQEGPPPMSMVLSRVQIELGELDVESMQKIEIYLQDPLMRRIDGSHMIPPSAVIPNQISQIVCRKNDTNRRPR